MKRFLRKLLWILHGGPRRLRVARLRRAGEIGEAMAVAFGHHESAIITLELLVREPDPRKRQPIYGQILRRWCCRK